VCRTAAAHRAPAEYHVHHLLDRIIVKASRPEPSGQKPAFQREVAAIEPGYLIDLIAWDELRIAIAKIVVT
jgi:hypothetical protein